MLPTAQQLNDLSVKAMLDRCSQEDQAHMLCHTCTVCKCKTLVTHDCSMKMQVVFTCMNAKYTVMSVDQCNAMSVTAITKT